MHGMFSPQQGFSFFGPNNGLQNVNFNFGANPSGMNPFALPDGGNGQQVLPGGSPMMLESRVVDSLLSGDSLSVSEDCKVVYGDQPLYYQVEREFKVGGVDDCCPIDDDPSYFIDSIDHKVDPEEGTEELFQGDYKAFLFNRCKELNKEPLLIIIDPNTIDKVSIDHYLYHTIFLAKKYNYNHFFLIIEESGGLEEGDPEPCYMNHNRCRVNVYYRKVEITDLPEDWVNYHTHKTQGQEYSEVSVDKLNMDQA